MATPRKIDRAGTTSATEPEAKVEVQDEFFEEPQNLFEALRAAVQEKVALEEISYKVPARPNISLLVDPNMDYEAEFRPWTKKVTTGGKKGAPQELDYMRLAYIILSNKCRAIQIDAKPVPDKDNPGYYLTVVSPGFHDMMGVPRGSTGAAIRKLYGRDADLIKTVTQIIEDAGYNVDGEIEKLDDEEDSFL